MCIHGRIEIECSECRGLGEAGFHEEIPFEDTDDALLDADDDRVAPAWFGAPGAPAQETLRRSEHRTLAQATADLRLRLAEYAALLKRLEAADSPAAPGVAAILRSLK
jgi:hypothetical protein